MKMVVDVQETEEIKISHKISAEEFVNILDKGAKRVVIPESVLDQSRIMALILRAIQTSSARGVPEIKIVRRGKAPKIIRRDWVDPFVRSLVGARPDPEGQVLVHILESGKPETPISELTASEIELLPRLEKMGQVEVTKDLRVKLTRLGATIARGTKKLYPEFWS